MTRETAPRFSGIGGHHSHKARTVEWLTPPHVLKALGPFKLDPCAPSYQPWATADRTFTRHENGLLQQWRGRSFVNPPYTEGEIALWLARLADHNHGTALIFARTDTDAFKEHVRKRASALLFIAGRLTFHFGERWKNPRTGKQYEVGDLAPGNAGAPTVLCAYGEEDADALAVCDLDGLFVPLRFPRSVLVSLFAASNEDEKRDNATWRTVLAEFFAEREGPVSLPELYSAFATHPKASTNANYAAKLRQQLQVGNYRRVAPGLWEQRT